METRKLLAMIDKLLGGMRGRKNGLIQLIGDLPSGIIMAEIGCWAGESTLMFLRSGKIKQLYAIDLWRKDWAGELEGSPEFLARVKTVYSQMDQAEESFNKRMNGFDVVKMKMTFQEAEKQLPKLDFVYIDADHRYEAVLKDIQTAKRLVKPGGIMS